jgi:hypothetical protein
MSRQSPTEPLISSKRETLIAKPVITPNQRQTMLPRGQDWDGSAPLLISVTEAERKRKCGVQEKRKAPENAKIANDLELRV